MVYTARSANMSPRVEVPGLVEGSNERPGDVILSSFWCRIADLACNSSSRLVALVGEDKVWEAMVGPSAVGARFPAGECSAVSESL